MGFPTIYLIKDGKIYKFEGARTVEGLKDFVNFGYE